MGVAGKVRKVPEKVSGFWLLAAPTYSSGPSGATTTAKGHIMSTTHTADAMSYTTAQTRGVPVFSARTGHRRRADGWLVRVDIEMDRWVGTLYTPEMSVKTLIVGSDAEVHAWANKVAA
jgi:hypothetical protein